MSLLRQAYAEAGSAHALLIALLLTHNMKITVEKITYTNRYGRTHRREGFAKVRKDIEHKQKLYYTTEDHLK